MSQLNVLIIEDKREWQQLIKDVLEMLNCHIEVVSNYNEARQKLEQGSFDVITLDMELNDADRAYSGWLLIRALDRGKYPKASHARVIILSGSVDFQHSPDKVAELHTEYKNMERFLWKGSHDWDDKLYETVKRVIERTQADSLAPADEPLNIARFLQVFNQGFNESEMRDLCIDLQVDYETLPGASKADKARELVLYFERRGNLVILIKTCRTLRPKLAW